MAHARKYKVEDREARKARRQTPRPSLVRDASAYEAEVPAVHKMQTDLERAVNAGEHLATSDGKIPVGYTILGASVFSTLCWYALGTLIHAVR